MEYKKEKGGICAAAGFKAAGIHCGIRKNKEKKDLALIYSEKECSAAAVYTKNKVFGAPIIVTREHLKNGRARAVIANSGNANTCNADGVEKARYMTKLAAEALGIEQSDVIVASTGVIGFPLDVTPIEKGIDELAAALCSNGSQDAANGIMTTDTAVKEVAYSFELGEKKVTLGAIAKGSGMICPNLATMLCFMTTDVNISKEMLWRVLSEVTKTTFNRVSVDGDTSTNDMACVLSSGLAGNSEIISVNDDYKTFKNALFEVMRYLSKEIARDGEGASKLLECVCLNAPDETTAEIVAKSVITSSLFKAAMFGEDANWGRVLCAIGYAPAEFDINLVDVSLSSNAGTIDVCKDGSGLDFSEETAKIILGEDEIRIIVNLKSGSETAEAWGCDLTYDYVKINGDYRS